MATSTRVPAGGLISILLGLAVLFGAATWLMTPPEHEVFALLKVSERPPSVLDKSGDAADQFGIFKRTQAQLVHSNVVLSGVAREPNIARLATVSEHSDDPVGWLREHLRVDFPDDAEIMRVSMTGPDPADLAKIVDKLVEVYLKEIVQRDRDLRLEHEAKLERNLSNMASDVQKRQEALRTLEALHQTSGSESARLKKEMALGELNHAMARRARIIDKLDDNAMQIMLENARRQLPAETRTSEAPPAGADSQAARSDKLDLALLEKQRDYLNEQLKLADEAIEKQARHVESLESFSAQVAREQEELRALREITTNVRSELDRIRVEKLAPERIVKIDSAVPTSTSRGDALRRYATAGAAAFVGLALVGLGIASRRPVANAM